ncbi:MAG TPA: phage tail assembly chaperone [Rhizomicrobium sp.]|jgi:uncharacterized phage protein (TIGR02216 family)
MAPRDFWAMSLPEWRAAVAGFGARRGVRPAPLSRAEFETLLSRYPDGTA